MEALSRKILLYIRYDGRGPADRPFCGYQAQKNGYSIQQALTEGAPHSKKIKDRKTYFLSFVC